MEDDETKRHEEKLNREKLDKTIAEEVKIEEARQKKIPGYEKKTYQRAKQERKGKVPKLEIIKFNRIYLDITTQKSFHSQILITVKNSNSSSL